MFVSRLNEFESNWLQWKIPQAVLQLSLNDSLHFRSILLLRNMFHWFHILSIKISENFPSRSCSKGRVFHRFLNVRHIHDYAYVTCQTKNICHFLQLPLTVFSRKIFRKSKGLESSRNQRLVTSGNWLLGKEGLGYYYSKNIWLLSLVLFCILHAGCNTHK